MDFLTSNLSIFDCKETSISSKAKPKALTSRTIMEDAHDAVPAESPSQQAAEDLPTCSATTGECRILHWQRSAKTDALQELIVVTASNPKGWTQDSKALDKFTLFPKLTIELRLKIWNEEIPNSRIIEVRWKDEETRFVTYASTPSILHACSESREVAKKRYEMLEVKNNWVYEEYCEEADKYTFRTFIDYSRDMLYLSTCDWTSAKVTTVTTYFLSQLHRATSKVQHFALDGVKHDPRQMSKFIALFPEVKNIYLVFGDPGSDARYSPKSERRALLRKIAGFKYANMEQKTLIRWKDASVFSIAWVKSIGRIVEIWGCYFMAGLRHCNVDAAITDALIFSPIDILREKA
ncbi:hypothetical protein BDZ45DRAFT_297478 [Acephala macrosclerotiorum]|nr:hypothetical protein BDZ45DRAFT_297478 [Acephala macrosclerotiorum]